MGANRRLPRTNRARNEWCGLTRTASQAYRRTNSISPLSAASCALAKTLGALIARNPFENKETSGKKICHGLSQAFDYIDPLLRQPLQNLYSSLLYHYRTD
jgi:hypothetical protein